MFVRNYFRSIHHRHISLHYTVHLVYSPPPPPPPPTQTKIDFNFSWVEQSSLEKAMLILRGIQTVSARVVFILAYYPFQQKNCWAAKLGDSPYQTSLLRANHYITSGHSCTIRKVAFVLVSRLKRLWNGGRGLSLKLAFSRLLFPLSATRKTRPVP